MFNTWYTYEYTKDTEWTLDLNKGIISIIIIYFMNKKSHCLKEIVEIYFPILFNWDPSSHSLPTELVPSH